MACDMEQDGIRPSSACALLGSVGIGSPELPPWLRRPKRREVFSAHSIKRGQPFPDFLVPAKSIAPLWNTISALVVSCVNESFPLLFVQVWLGKRKTGGDSTQISCLSDATYGLVCIGKILIRWSSWPVLPKKIVIAAVINDPLSSVNQQEDTHTLRESTHVIANRCQHLLSREGRGPDIGPKVHRDFPNGNNRTKIFRLKTKAPARWLSWPAGYVAGTGEVNEPHPVIFWDRPRSRLLRCL